MCFVLRLPNYRGHRLAIPALLLASALFSEGGRDGFPVFGLNRQLLMTTITQELNRPGIVSKHCAQDTTELPSGVEMVVSGRGSMLPSVCAC